MCDLGDGVPSLLVEASYGRGELATKSEEEFTASIGHKVDDAFRLCSVKSFYGVQTAPVNRWP